MNIYKRIRQLSLGQLFKFALLFLRNPLHIIPTLRATKQTFAICTKLYGNDHNAPNKGNAFRHALWNALICKNIQKRSKNKQKSVFWTQKVTDLYEKVTKNEKLDEAMDLHNNMMGRLCFLNFIDQNEAELIDFIEKKAENAKKVTDLSEIDKTNNQFVYLND